MDAFGLVPNIIATIETTYKVIKFFEEIKSSGLDCNRYISEASSSYIILQQVRERLDNNVADGHSLQPWSCHLQALAGEDGVLRHYKSDMEQVAKILLEVKNYRFRRVFVWHREKGKIEDILSKAERHKSAIQLALAHDQLSLSGHTHEVLNRVEARIETTATLQATEKVESRKEEIIEWIYQSTVNHDNFQRDYNAAAQDGTGQAFLSSDTFRRWLEGTCTTIFCPGLPGAGKTVMASIVKSYLDEKTMGSNDLSAVLYFNYKRHLEDHGHQTLLLAVLAQFLSRSEKVPDHLQRMYNKKPRDPLRMDDIISILESLVQSSHKNFLIMDALDEYYDDDGARSRFLHLIQRLQASGNLRIMMTARPHLSDDPALSKWSHATIQITASDDDLHTYLDHKICGFPYLPDDFDLRLSIADRIVEASAGIFLLAVLHSDSLKDAYNAFEVEDILENLSKGPDALDRAYEDATKRIDHQPANRQYYAHLTISWMVQCLQPLTPMELQHAVTKPEHLERGLTASSLVKIDTLVSFCAGLVTIDHESNVVRFVHYTTQEYFTRDRLTKWLPGADLDPARVCTKYLMNSKLLKAIERDHETWLERAKKQRELLLSYDWYGYGNTNELPDGLDDLDIKSQDELASWPLLEYCKKHWGSHCSESQTQLQKLLLEFLTGPAKIVYREPELQWGAHYTLADPLGWFETGGFVAHANLRRVTPISICSRWGLNHLITKLLDQGSDIRVAPMLKEHLGNSSGCDYRAVILDSPPLRHIALDEPFLLACQMGNMELAALLLARTSICDVIYYEAFRAADEKKNLDVLDVIITRCPLDTISLNQIAMCSSIDEPRIRNSLLGCTLHISPDGNLEGFRVMFTRPNAAFWAGYLLEQGMDVNKSYSPYGDDLSYFGPYKDTGIQFAAAAGCLETVRIFLKYPDVQVCRAGHGDEDYAYRPYDALGLAAEGGHLEIVRALLSHISSIPDQSDVVRASVGRLFQRLTARYGPRTSEMAFLKCLLESQDLNHLTFSDLQNAIKLAVSKAWTCDDLDKKNAMLDLILHQSSIDFRRRSTHGRTLLQTALPHALTREIYGFERANESVSSDEWGEAPWEKKALYWDEEEAVSSNEEEAASSDDRDTRALKMLLSHPSFDYTGQYNPITEFLTEHKFTASRVSEQENGGMSIIAKLEMVLRDSRFNPDTPDETGRTALSYASEYHIAYLVRMLIQHPLVDVNSRDVYGRTPLSYASGSKPGEDDSGEEDSGEDDAGEDDAGEDDAGEDDAGEDDAGEDDAGEDDVGVESVLPILLANDKVREYANSPDTDGVTPLMYSRRLGLEEAVRLLLDVEGLE